MMQSHLDSVMLSQDRTLRKIIGKRQSAMLMSPANDGGEESKGRTQTLSAQFG